LKGITNGLRGDHKQKFSSLEVVPVVKTWREDGRSFQEREKIPGDEESF